MFWTGWCYGNGVSLVHPGRDVEICENLVISVGCVSGRKEIENVLQKLVSRKWCGCYPVWSRCENLRKFGNFCWFFKWYKAELKYFTRVGQPEMV